MPSVVVVAGVAGEGAGRRGGEVAREAGELARGDRGSAEEGRHVGGGGRRDEHTSWRRRKAWVVGFKRNGGRLEGNKEPEVSTVTLPIAVAAPINLLSKTPVRVRLLGRPPALSLTKEPVNAGETVGPAAHNGKRFFRKRDSGVLHLCTRDHLSSSKSLNKYRQITMRIRR
jgi:hypothetical protein